AVEPPVTAQAIRRILRIGLGPFDSNEIRRWLCGGNVQQECSLAGPYLQLHGVPIAENFSMGNLPVLIRYPQQDRINIQVIAKRHKIAECKRNSAVRKPE